MKRSLFSVVMIAALGAPIAFATPGADALDACEAAMEKAAAEQFAGMEYDFRTMRGHSLKKLKYRVTYNGDRMIATCKARNGEVIEVTWPEALIAAVEGETKEG